MRKTKQYQPPAPAIVQLRGRVEHWRKTRTSRKPMPAALWSEAVAAAREHGVFAVCRETALNYGALKGRLRSEPQAVALPESDFVELKLPVSEQAVPSRGLEVEWVLAGGDRMIMRLPAAEHAEAVALAREFWSRAR
jgi:hypothetical protein